MIGLLLLLPLAIYAALLLLPRAHWVIAIGMAVAAAICLICMAYVAGPPDETDPETIGHVVARLYLLWIAILFAIGAFASALRASALEGTPGSVVALAGLGPVIATGSIIAIPIDWID